MKMRGFALWSSIFDLLFIKVDIISMIKKEQRTDYTKTELHLEKALHLKSFHDSKD